MIKKNISMKCVGDVCTVNPPLCTEINTSLPLIAFYMDLMKVEAAAVIDQKRHCIGFVISEDVTNFILDDNAREEDMYVGNVMRLPNMSMYQDDSIEKALLMMNRYRIDWLPVLDFDTQKFAGLVSRKDIKNGAANIISFSKEKCLSSKKFQTDKREIL